MKTEIQAPAEGSLLFPIPLPLPTLPTYLSSIYLSSTTFLPTFLPTSHSVSFLQHQAGGGRQVRNFKFAAQTVRQRQRFGERQRTVGIDSQFRQGRPRQTETFGGRLCGICCLL